MTEAWIIYVTTCMLIAFPIHHANPKKFNMWKVFFAIVTVPLVIGVVLGKYLNEK